YCFIFFHYADSPICLFADLLIRGFAYSAMRLFAYLRICEFAPSPPFDPSRASGASGTRLRALPTALLLINNNTGLLLWFVERHFHLFADQLRCFVRYLQ